ncbi:hypothetical protein PFISCL1PPCAC_18893, partial [Pristionchus fissidentatus]
LRSSNSNNIASLNCDETDFFQLGNGHPGCLLRMFLFFSHQTTNGRDNGLSHVCHDNSHENNEKEESKVLNDHE